MKSFMRTSYIAILPILILSILFNTVFSSQTSAFSSNDVKKTLQAGWVSECTRGVFTGKSIANSDTEIFNESLKDKMGDDLIIGHIVETGSGKLECNKKTINEVLKSLGYTDMRGFMSDMGCKKSGSNYVCPELTQIGIYNKISKQKSLIDITDDVKYDVAYRTFVTGCKAERLPSTETFSNGNNTHVMATEYVDGELREVAYKITGRNRAISTINTSTNGATSSWTDNGQFQCDSLANMTAKYGPAYKLAVKNGSVDSPVTLESATVGIADSGEAADGEDGPTCVIDGIGWIICPVVSFLADVADQAYSFLSGQFLEVPATLFDRSSDAGGQLYSTWSAFLGFANAALVIVFIVIIYSHMTSVGISALSLKKMVPRLVIVAILVNLSYYICAIAVDLSNILGYALKSVFDVVGSTTAVSDGESSWLSTGFGGWGGIASTVMVGTVAAVAIGTVGLISMLIPAVIALVMIFLILTLRQALVVLLVVIAPLAFVAYTLPNTEQWFSRWRKMFTSVLLVFPIVGLIFGASALASQVMGYTVGGDDIIGQIATAGIAILPLFVVPSLLKKSLSSVGEIGGKIANMGDKAGAGAKGKFANSEYAKYKKEEGARGQASITSGAYSGANPLNRLRSSANRKINNSRFSGRYGNRRNMMAARLDAVKDKENMEAADQWLINQGIDNAKDALAIATGSGDEYQRRSALKYLEGRMTVKQAEELAASGGAAVGGVEKSAKERQAVASAVRSMKADVPHLATGANIGAIEAGRGIDAKQAALQWATNNASGDALMTAKPEAIKNIVDAAKDNPEALQSLSRARSALEANPNSSKVGEAARKEIDKIPMSNGYASMGVADSASVQRSIQEADAKAATEAEQNEQARAVAEGIAEREARKADRAKRNRMR